MAATAVPASAGGLKDGYGTAGYPIQVGGMVVITPKYEGGKDYRVTGFPIIAPAGLTDGDGIVQFRGIDDLRFRAIHSYGFEAGPLVGWRFGREDDDADILRGLGDVDGGLVAGGYVAYRVGNFKPFLSYHHQVTGDETGGILRFGLETNMTLGRGITARATVGAEYADDDYMDAYFSITPGQQARSRAGLATYNADAGIKSVFVGVTSDVPLTELWTLKLSGRYARLVGDAADSPVVESENQFTAGIGLTYRFNLGR